MQGNICAAVLAHGLTWQYAKATHFGLHHGRPRLSQLGTNIVSKDRLSDLILVIKMVKIRFC